MGAARSVGALAMLTFAALAVAPAAAQVRSSEAASVSQTVDGTDITVEYSRPVARGRENLFGGVVAWGRVWTAGANWATTLEVSAAVRVNGEPVPQGRYSVWMIPREGADWSVILHPDARRFHSQPPGPEDGEEALRIEVAPRTGPHMETLLWYFPVVTRDGATLRMHWGETLVPLRLTVKPSKSVALSVAERRPYVGRYTMTPEPDDGEGAPVAVEIFEDGDRLRARMDLRPPGRMASEFDLIPATARPARDHRFNPGRIQHGALHDVDAETALVFHLTDGRATGFELWGLERVLGRGERER